MRRRSGGTWGLVVMLLTSPVVAVLLREWLAQRNRQRY